MEHLTLEDRIGCWTTADYGLIRFRWNFISILHRLKRVTKRGDVQELSIWLARLGDLLKTIEDMRISAVDRLNEIIAEDAGKN